MRRIRLVLCSLLLAALACSKSEPAGPSGNPVVTPPVVSKNWIRLLTTGYLKIPADTLSLSVPQAIQCPDTGSTPTVIAASTQTTPYKLTRDTLKLVMTSAAMQSIIGRMPGVNSSTLATLVDAGEFLKNPVYASMVDPLYASFYAGSHDSIKGEWIFTRIDLGRLRTVLPGMNLGALVDTVDAISATLTGKLLLEISATQIKASVRRDYYTEEFVRGIADTAVYTVLVSRVKDSLYTVSNQAADSVVTITGLDNGDMVFSGTVPAWVSYTYYLNPITCPNYAAPSWYGIFREARPKQ